MNDANTRPERPPRGDRSTPDPTADEVRRLCPRSFASHPENHVDPADVDGWGVCRTCGETVNTSGKQIPEHLVPAGVEL
jgi:hypothetical protein